LIKISAIHLKIIIMAKLSKKRKVAESKVDREKLYALADAVKLVKEVK